MESNTMSNACTSLGSSTFLSFLDDSFETLPYFSKVFHSHEDILKVMTTLKYPWGSMHHFSFVFLEWAIKSLAPPATNICVVENKYLIPLGHVDWVKTPISTPNSFEEGNMANISPTIEVDMYSKLNIIEELTLGEPCPSNEVNETQEAT